MEGGNFACLLTVPHVLECTVMSCVTLCVSSCLQFRIIGLRDCGLHRASDLVGGSLVQDYTVSAEICLSSRHNSRQDYNCCSTASAALMRQLNVINKTDGHASSLMLAHYSTVKHFQFVPQRNTDTKYLFKMASTTPCVSMSVWWLQTLPFSWPVWTPAVVAISQPSTRLSGDFWWYQAKRRKKMKRGHVQRNWWRVD